MAGINSFIAIGKSAREVEMSPLNNADPATFPVDLLLTLSCKEIAAVCSCLAGTREPWASKSWLA